MVNLFKIKSKKAGLPPGSLVHVGEQKTEKVKITIIDYDETQFQEKEVKSVEECFPYKDKPTVTWIDINGVHQVDIIEKIGKEFALHPLVLEDVMNTGQRPKIDYFEDYIFIVLKIPYYHEEKKELSIEQLSLFLGKTFVLSFHEDAKYIFKPIRDRLETVKYPIRKFGADYLAYTLIDIAIDNYFVIMENIENKLDDIEDDLLEKPSTKTLHAIHNLKRELLFLNKSLWPSREVINSLKRGESPLVKASTKIYLRDVYDHTIRIIEGIETFREMLTGMMDIYLSSVSNKMNEIMMFLTIIGTIFIPLTFITGIYGMNFKYMPELKWYWGYPTVLAIMLGIGVIMLFFFRRKKWL